jgi:hypothetical protein
MPSLTKADDRVDISIADTPELAKMLQSGKGGEVTLRGAMEAMLGGGTLYLDGLRRRPRYFDGRFLTGADLTRDQDYIRQRQADIARSAGSGVASGLQVIDYDVEQGESVEIKAGHGITPSGDLVMLASDRQVAILDLPVARQLDAAMGLSSDPRIPLTRRSGLFILGLRAVEFTANPIAAYPRSITGRASIQDGDIIEATAVTLVPFPENSGAATLAEARRAVARQIFMGKGGGISQNILPLAMVALDRGIIQWIDVAMVRRELGADSGIQVAISGRPRSLAEAHVVQHRAHLQDVLADLNTGNAAPIFAASQYFSLLPPAGQLPVSSVRSDSQGLQQYYFPPSVDVDVAFVPSDEIVALVEESLTLPPIDLDGRPEELDATGVVILVPVSRQRFQSFNTLLTNTTRPTKADPVVAKSSSAIEMLDALLMRREKQKEQGEAKATSEAEKQAFEQEIRNWQNCLIEAVANIPTPDGSVPLLWYVRRRTIAYRSQVEGLAIKVSGDDVGLTAIVNDNLSKLGLEKRVAALSKKATAEASARVVTLLGSPRIAASDVMTAAVVADLEKVADGTIETVIPAAIKPALQPFNMAASEINRGMFTAGPITAAPTLRPAATKLNEMNILGRSTALRSDTKLGLSESEVIDLASDYGGNRVGEGIAAVEKILGADWPDRAAAIFLGDNSLALPIDAAFQKVKPESLNDLAKKLGDAVKKKDLSAIQDVLKTANG